MIPFKIRLHFCLAFTASQENVVSALTGVAFVKGVTYCKSAYEFCSSTGGFVGKKKALEHR